MQQFGGWKNKYNNNKKEIKLFQIIPLQITLF